MGGKRSGQGQRFYLSVACIILFLIAACVPDKKVIDPCYDRAEPVSGGSAAGNHLTDVRSYLAAGDFEGAMEASQSALDRSPKEPPGDEALMNLGLISAHYGNPKKDYKKAQAYFTRLVREFPNSPLAEEAKIWVSVLQSFEKAKQVDIEIEKKKKELKK
jgi:TolA-binding protein